MTLQELAELYKVSAKTLSRKIEEEKLDINTSSLLYPKDIQILFDTLGRPGDQDKPLRKKKPKKTDNNKNINPMICLLGFISMLFFPANVQGQVIYASGEIPFDPIGSLIKIDLATCTFCRVAYQFDPSEFDMVLLSNGNVVNASDIFIRVYTPPNQDPVFTVNILPQAARGSILNPAGTIYISTTQGLGVFNPTTNQFTYIGDWPASFLPISQMELWYDGGQLYGFFGPPPTHQVALIDVNNPGNSSIVGVINNIYLGGDNGACNVGDSIIMCSYNVVYQYDHVTGDLSTICDFSNTTVIFTGLSNIPAGFPNLPCLCTTSAGTIVPQSLMNYCTDETVAFVHNNNESLDNNDLLQFVLFSNPNDTAGSIVAVSNTPSFSFDPNTMQTGMTYYMAAMAGDNLNGNVDLDDPCLDFSNANPVVWRPLPTIVLSVANPNVCNTGGCTTVTAALSGTPPFSFVYGLLVNGNQIGNSVTVNTNDTSHNFLVCLPPGTPLGQVQIVACSLTDLYCTSE